ncbi:MAG: hypothetical protein L7V86_06565 [Verrucomicrobiales bacterium]|jgi:hypothetical protein|nr:hypothetical protein [Verrucomicrobiales bacterium]
MSEITFPGKASDFLKIGVAAAGHGDLDAVRAILKARPKWIHHLGSSGRTLLRGPRIAASLPWSSTW